MIYFDNAATTKPSLTALNKAKVFNEDFFYNPSALYRYGLHCANAIKEAKNSILKTLGVSENKYEVIFTSCGTESDNTAIFCATKRGTFVTDCGEHSAVIKCFNELKNQGRTVCFCGIDKNGKVNEDELMSLVNKVNAGFVSVMHVNNETGAINDISSVSKLLKSSGSPALLHTDAVQAFMKIPFTPKSLGADMISVSGHKIHAPKGIGALYVRSGLRLKPYIMGGSQEDGRRAGTEAMPQIAAFGEACRIAKENLAENAAKMAALRQLTIDTLTPAIPELQVINGADPHILSISLPGWRSEVLMNFLEARGVYVSRSSACKKGARSHVLEAIGLDSRVIDGAIRIGLCRYNTEEDIRALCDGLIEAHSTLAHR